LTYLYQYTVRILWLLLVVTSCSERQKKENPKPDLLNENPNHPKACCEKSRAELILTQSSKSNTDTILPENSNHLKENISESMVLIEGGVFLMGSSDSKMALKREFPQHKVKVNSFYMDAHEVTNAQFSKFVNATGYKTVAEKPVNWEILQKQLPPNTQKPSEDFLQPGSMVFSPKKGITNLIDFSQWWQWVNGANWKHPFGPESTIEGKENYPVVHICYSDAVAYAGWCGKRLPTEAEWEWAARGGLKNKVYPWGDKFLFKGKENCNYWTGTFPNINTASDGFEGLAPVMHYQANGYGLYDMAGNVWEICSDWYDERYYSSFKNKPIVDNPKGPKTWHYPIEPHDPKRVIRGGSFLCNKSYCSSYRVSARMPYSQDTGMSHTGFRCVKNK